MNGLILILALTISALSINAQSTDGDALVDERFFYAENKQLNQFFRRFNGEEDILGNRYYEKDKLYRDTKLRKDYINTLFDEQNPLMKADEKRAFINQVTQEAQPQYLNFHGGKWMAEVQAKFEYQDTIHRFCLFFKLQSEEVGSKWVLFALNTKAFDDFLGASYDTTMEKEKFLHPLSHELDFTNLIKYFKSEENLQPFISKDFEKDQLSLFLLALKMNALALENIDKVKFHFWQIPGWYFEVERFNRKDSYNNGLLISKLSRVPDAQKSKWVNAIIHE